MLTSCYGLNLFSCFCRDLLVFGHEECLPRRPEGCGLKRPLGAAGAKIGGEQPAQPVQVPQTPTPQQQSTPGDFLETTPAPTHAPAAAQTPSDPKPKRPKVKSLETLTVEEKGHDLAKKALKASGVANKLKTEMEANKYGKDLVAELLACEERFKSFGCISV